MMFITLEGQDGSGKTTQAKLLCDSMREQGLQVVSLREPGSSPIGEALRDVVLMPSPHPLDLKAETMLFLAARAQLISETVGPALADGKVVVCDRFSDSTLAYQGFGRGQDLEKLHPLVQYASGGLCPDLTVWLDLDPLVGMGRVQEPNRFEGLGLDFQQRVRNGYRVLAASDPQRWFKVDAAQGLQEVHQRIREHVAERLAEREGLPDVPQSVREWNMMLGATW